MSGRKSLMKTAKSALRMTLNEGYPHDYRGEGLLRDDVKRRTTRYGWKKLLVQSGLGGIWLDSSICFHASSVRRLLMGCLNS